MHETITDVKVALSRSQECGETLQIQLLLVVREALMFDASPPDRPTANGFPECIQAAIAVGTALDRAMRTQLTARSPSMLRDRIPWSPVTLLAGALLRSQGVEVDSRSLERSRLDCQRLNFFLHED